MAYSWFILWSNSFFDRQNCFRFKIRLFAIATLGISEIIIYIIKNEEWLARGVKNVNGLPRPVPYEIDLQKNEFIQTLSNTKFISDRIIFFDSKRFIFNTFYISFVNNLFPFTKSY